MKTSAYLIGAAVVIASLSAQAQSLPDFLGSIFNPIESEFRSAMKDRHFNQALIIYERNAANLRTNKELVVEISSLLEYARADKSRDLESSIASLTALREKKAFRQSLDGYLTAIRLVTASEARYLAESRILKDFEQTDPLLIRSSEEKKRASQDIRAEIGDVYRSFPHERKSFSSAFNEATNETELFERNWQVLSQKIAELGDADARAFVRNTSSAWSAKPTLREKVGAAVWQRLSSSDRSPIGKLRIAPTIEQYGLSRSDIQDRPKLLVLNSATDSEAPIKLSSTFDGVARTSEEILSPSGADATPAIVVHIEESTSKRNILDKQEISSSYRSGTRSVLNPNYAIAQMECQRAQSDYAAQQARNTIAPAKGWGALLQGVAEGVAGANARKTCGQFAATSPSSEEDVYTSYAYTVTDVEVTKGVRGKIVAYDGDKGVESYPFSVDEKKNVKVAYGRKEGDRTPFTGMTDAELDALGSKAIELDPEKMVHAIDLSTRKSHGRAELAVLLEKPRTQPAARPTLATSGNSSRFSAAQVNSRAENFQADQSALDVRMQSVVVVLSPKGAIGAGFYVDTNDIITNYHVVEGASTMELRSLDGQLFTGRVIKKDIGTDLALIRVERIGVPLQFASTIVKTGETVEAIGHPKGLFYSVSRGIVSAIRQVKGVLAPGADKALVIQTDASINPGNSGGPLFIRDRVVGVNTIKFKGADGIGFAIHYSEVVRFLSQ